MTSRISMFTKRSLSASSCQSDKYFPLMGRPPFFEMGWGNDITRALEGEEGRILALCGVSYVSSVLAGEARAACDLVDFSTLLRWVFFSFFLVLSFSTSVPILKLFDISSIVSLLKPTNFLVMTSVVIRKIVHVATVSSADITARSSLLEINSQKCPKTTLLVRHLVSFLHFESAQHTAQMRKSKKNQYTVKGKRKKGANLTNTIQQGTKMIQLAKKRRRFFSRISLYSI